MTLAAMVLMALAAQHALATYDEYNPDKSRYLLQEERFWLTQIRAAIREGQS